MSQVRQIKLPCYDMVITIDDDGTGNIASSLDPMGGDTALDGIEALILAHACAGIDVTAPAYIEGVETAVDAALNNID